MPPPAPPPPSDSDHDLRGHLHAIAGYAEALRDGLAGDISPRQREFAEAILDSVNRLGLLLQLTAGAPAGAATMPAPVPAPPGDGRWALVVEDDTRFADLLVHQLAAAGLAAVVVPSAEAAWQVLARRRPDLVTLDVLLPGEDGWAFLARLKAEPGLADVPVVVVSVLDDDGRGMALGATDVLQKPVSRQALESALNELGLNPVPGRTTTVLVADDEPAAVEILATYLGHRGCCRVLRAGGGAEAIALARAERPDAIVLDLLMPVVSGFDVIRALRADPATAAIPVLVVSGASLTAAERDELTRSVSGIVAKQRFDRDAFLAQVRAATGCKAP